MKVDKKRNFLSVVKPQEEQSLFDQLVKDVDDSKKLLEKIISLLERSQSYFDEEFSRSGNFLFDSGVLLTRILESVKNSSKISEWLQAELRRVQKPEE